MKNFLQLTSSQNGIASLPKRDVKSRLKHTANETRKYKTAATIGLVSSPSCHSSLRVMSPKYGEYQQFKTRFFIPKDLTKSIQANARFPNVIKNRQLAIKKLTNSVATSTNNCADRCQPGSVMDRGLMTPGARNKFGAPHVRTWGLAGVNVLNWSTCDIFGTFRRPGLCPPCHPLVRPLCRISMKEYQCSESLKSVLFPNSRISRQLIEAKNDSWPTEAQLGVANVDRTRNLRFNVRWSRS